MSLYSSFWLVLGGTVALMGGAPVAFDPAVDFWSAVESLAPSAT